MFHFPALLLALSVAGSVTAAPTHLNKRIAQTISDSTKAWEGACNGANGGPQCNTIAVNAFSTLLAAAGPCDQQDNADIMMDLSKKLNSPDMIKFAQIFGQQPRNSPDSLSVQYCQKAPRNAELNGLFQCQFEGVDTTNFTGGLKVGDSGTIPFGQSKILNPPGSCPAHPGGPIADGTQLVDQVSSPGVPSTTGAVNGNTQNPPSVSPMSSNTPSTADSSVASPVTSTCSPTPSSSSDSSVASPVTSTCSPTPSTSSDSSVASPVTSTSTDSSVASPVTSTSTDSSVASPVTSTTSPTPSSSSSKGFVFQNGKDAQALNTKFKSLTPDSPCNDGEQACVNGDFAQCVNGKFVMTPCSAGEMCTALPLVNSPGTSIACDTPADAAARLANALSSGN